MALPNIFHKQDSNWDIVRKAKPGETLRNRDVYQDQQLERGKEEKVQTMTTRAIFAGICGILTFLGVYLALGMVNYVGVQVLHVTQTATSQMTGQKQKTKPVKQPKGILNNNAGDDGTVMSMTIAHSKKGYRIENFSGDPQTTWFKHLNQLPIKSNWEINNASKYGFKYDGDPNSTAVVTIGQIKSGKAAKVAQKQNQQKQNRTHGMGYYLLMPTFTKVMLSLAAGFGVFASVYAVAKRNLKAQNATVDNRDINQYRDDSHIALPEEVMQHFEPFPDAGAHSSVEPSSLISHTAISNKGLKKVLVTERFEKDTYDSKTHELIGYKGAPKFDANGKRIQRAMPMIDTNFMEDLFTASGDPKDKSIRKYYDMTKVKFTPENVEDVGFWKKKGVKTVADVINKDWDLPAYETQRPAGVYWVDTAPVNTMVLAITRGGKGQTIIEPTIDMWTREKRPNNMVVNDPKGELLKKFYVPGTYRGYQIVQFNLINSLNTDIYNPLVLAAEAAQDGDFIKCSAYVQNIATVFFPVKGSDDPVWPNAANNAFKRAAFGLIDYFLEEEKELRNKAMYEHIDPQLLNTKIDQLWGKVTLYNCYQLFVQLSAKTITNPLNQYNADQKSGALQAELTKELALNGITENDPNFKDEIVALAQKKMEEAKAKAELWDSAPKQDELTLFFNATDKLPRSQMRVLVGNANNALKSMGGADKMMASVYAIAITAMSFFTDPTIATLTSGTPSQNIDLAGVSFPRRINIRLASKFVSNWNLTGQQAVWQAYKDPSFSKASSLGSEFHHEGLIDRTHWAKMYFKGIFPTDTVYLKCIIRNITTGMHICSFYFKFVKSYQTSLSGRTYTKNPILGNRIVKNGVLYELRPYKSKRDGKIHFTQAHKMYKSDEMINIETNPTVHKVLRPVITQTSVHYSEQPKMIFLVTPPHLMSYAQIILILLKQLVDLNFDQSYMTKGNQKPLYKTRFMLDELGNLQSDGHGIDHFQTMLSIGLGQSQQFTLILQTLQQLKDVYGDSVDKIVQGNTSNIIFLKSTDDSMIDTLSKMSGKTHRSRKNSKTVTRNMAKLTMRNEGKISYTISTQEEPVITYNDLYYISERNSIVFRAGDMPIWNRNQTILPMSWRLLKNNIKQPGVEEYTFSTIPTLSSAKDFDVRHNQPDFDKMLKKRIKQALKADEAKAAYKKARHMTDAQINMLDPDDYSDEIMNMINVLIGEYKPSDASSQKTEQDGGNLSDVDNLVNNAEENKDQEFANQQALNKAHTVTQKLFARGKLSRNDLFNNGHPNQQWDQTLIEIYQDNIADFKRDKQNFIVTDDGSLKSADGQNYFILAQTSSEHAKDVEAIKKSSADGQSSVYNENNDNDVEIPRSYQVTPQFYEFLSQQKTWRNLAGGIIDDQMANAIDG